MKTTIKGTLAFALSFIFGYGLYAENLVNTISSADTVLDDTYEVDTRTTPSQIGYGTGLYITAPTYSAGLGENLTVTAVGDYDGDFWVSHPYYHSYGSATAVAFAYVSGIGDINATMSATALGTYGKGYSFGLNLYRSSFAEGAQINAKIYSENRGVGDYVRAYGLYAAEVALPDIGADAVITVKAAYSGYGISLIYDSDTIGKMAGKVYVNSELVAMGIDYGTLYQQSYDISGEVHVYAKADARAITNSLRNMTLNMSGNAFVSARSDDPSTAYAVFSSYSLTINGDEGTQTFLGNMRAGREITIGDGNFVFGANHDRAVWKTGYSYSITISGGTSAKFINSALFDIADKLNLDGDITLVANSMADYVTLTASYTNVVIGEEATLTLILANDFAVPATGELLLIDAVGYANTITGDFAESFDVYFADGRRLDESKYELIENGTQVILQFLDNIPEPSSYAAVFCLFAFAFTLCGRKKRGIKS